MTDNCDWKEIKRVEKDSDQVLKKMRQLVGKLEEGTITAEEDGQLDQIMKTGHKKLEENFEELLQLLGRK